MADQSESRTWEKEKRGGFWILRNQATTGHDSSRRSVAMRATSSEYEIARIAQLPESSQIHLKFLLVVRHSYLVTEREGFAAGRLGSV